MKSKLQQIADAAGVSLSTVKNVLGQQADAYADQTCARIRRAARQLGYRPNGAARAVASGRFNAAALVCRDSSQFFPHSLIRGIHGALAARNMNMVIAEVGETDTCDTAVAPKILRESCVDGLLVHYSDIVSHAVIEAANRYDVPAVWINTNNAHDCVYPDDLGGGRLATEQLIADGHKRIAYLTFQDDALDTDRLHYSDRDRYQGYMDAMHAAGLEPQVVHHPVSQADLGASLERDKRIAHARDMLQTDPAPSAVVARTKQETGALVAAAMAVGLHIPADLAITVFHDSRLHELAVPVDVMQIPMWDVGMEGVRMLLQKIECTGESIPSVAIPYRGPESGVRSEQAQQKPEARFNKHAVDERASALL